MKLIDCSTRKFPNSFAMVDDEDFEYLNRWKWNTYKGKASLYARRHEYKNGISRNVSMHREIIKPKANKVVDHIDHNGMNNQKRNLRACTNQQNCFNRKRSTTSKSKYIGVTKRQSGLYRALTRVNTIKTHIGSYKTEIEAAKAYDDFVLRHRGEFSVLNFPSRSLLDYSRSTQPKTGEGGGIDGGDGEERKWEK